MKSLREYITDAQKEKRAVGHFNISTLDALWGIFKAAQALNVPVIIGVSEGERDFIGLRQVAAIVKSIREEYDYPIFLNADHSYSLERCKAAIDAGFDAVIFDGAKLSTEENIHIAKEVVEYAKASGRDVLVEAELGYIGSSSKVLDAVPEGAALSDDDLTKPEEAKTFVETTGVDLFSPAIGSIHGMLRTTSDPDLHIARIKEIAAIVSTPLVLHGASGLSDENVAEAIEAGISVVHVNTEIRVAWRNALRFTLQEHEDEVAPYKLLRPATMEIEKLISKKLKLFNRIN